MQKYESHLDSTESAKPHDVLQELNSGNRLPMSPVGTTPHLSQSQTQISMVLSDRRICYYTWYQQLGTYDGIMAINLGIEVAQIWLPDDNFKMLSYQKQEFKELSCSCYV